MKVLLYDDLFYYTIVIVTYIHMQELMWPRSVSTICYLRSSKR